LTNPSNKYDIEVFPYQDHGEEVEEKTRVEGKTRRKRRQGVEDKDQEKIAQVKKMKVLDLMT
jgi:hypothetical protein